MLKILALESPYYEVTGGVGEGSGGLHTSRGLPDGLSHFQHSAERRCPSGRGGVTVVGLLASLAMQGTLGHRENIRGAESSSKDLARMPSPVRHFSRGKWDTMDPSQCRSAHYPEVQV